MGSDRRFQHHVYALGGGPMAERFAALGIPVRAAAADQSFLSALAGLVAYSRREGISLIHTNNTTIDRTIGQVAALVLRIPAVNTFHAALLPPIPTRSSAAPPHRSSITGQARRVASRIARELQACLMHASTGAWIAVSSVARDSFARHYRLPAERIAVIPPGLPPEAFATSAPVLEAEAQRSTPIPEGAAPLILNIGRLEVGKGQALLIPMMQRIVERWPRAHLLVAGEGDARADLEQAIEQANLTQAITLLGNRTDVPQLLRRCDVLVSASLAEGFGLTLLEAMAASKPVVAVHLPAYDDFMQPGLRGTLVAAADPALLAAEIEKLAADPALARSLGAVGYVRAQDFTIARTAARTAEIYDAVLKRADPGFSSRAIRRARAALSQG